MYFLVWLVSGIALCSYTAVACIVWTERRAVSAGAALKRASL
jgi:hypothetical protein